MIPIRRYDFQDFNALATSLAPHTSGLSTSAQAATKALALVTEAERLMRDAIAVEIAAVKTPKPGTILVRRCDRENSIFRAAILSWTDHYLTIATARGPTKFRRDIGKPPGKANVWAIVPTLDEDELRAFNAANSTRADR